MKRLSFLFVFLLSFFRLATFPVFASVIYDTSTLNDFYNIRFDGSIGAGSLSTYGSALGGGSPVSATDFDSDGLLDLVMDEKYSGNNGLKDSGSIYIVYGSLLQSLSGNVDLATSSNYSLRFDGAEVNQYFGKFHTVADVNNDNKPDLIVNAGFSDQGSITDSGSVYVICNDLIRAYANTGNNIAMSNPANYNTRIDGATVSGYFSVSGLTTKDMDGDGKIEIITGSKYMDNSAGSVWVIPNSVFNNCSSTGNTINISNPNNYMFKIDGPYATALFSDDAIVAEDLDNDSRPDLIIPASEPNYNGRLLSGSVYIIYGSLLSQYPGLGNSLNMANTSHFSIRFDGANTWEWLGTAGILTGDLNNNSKPDLLIAGPGAALNGRDYSGCLYVLYDSLLASYSSPGTVVDMADRNNFNVRIDGATEDSLFGFEYVNVIDDFDNDGLNDIYSGANHGHNNGIFHAGAVYIIYSPIFNHLTGVGNTLDLLDENNFSIRYDGPAYNYQIGASARSAADLNNDGKIDYIIPMTLSDYNGRTNAGSVFIIYNFPHAITATSVTTPTNINSFSVTGSVSAPNSVTNISGVQYSIDNNSPTASTWTACNASDGAFDSTSEDYSCSISSLVDGVHTIYFRAYDANTSYTPQSNYASVSVTVDATNPEGFTWQTLSRRLKSGNDMIHTVADGGFTSDHKVALSWEKEGDATSGIESYKVYYREKGDKKWILIDEVGADTDFVWVDEDPGTYEWYVKAIDYAGNETDSEIFTFTIVDTPEGAPIINLVNGVAPVSGNVYLGWSDALTVVGIADSESGVVVAIYDPVGQTRYQEILCSSDSAGFFTCADPALMNSTYHLKIFSRNEVGDEGPVTQIMINGSLASYSSILSEPTGSAPSVSVVQGTTTTELAPGIVRGGVAINNSGIVSGVVDFPEPKLAPEPPRQNIFQRVWNTIFQ